jgi:hypothetical protein
MPALVADTAGDTGKVMAEDPVWVMVEDTVWACITGHTATEDRATVWATAPAGNKLQSTKDKG